MRKWLFSLQTELSGLALWLKPGLGVKRWLLMLLTGITLLGVGVAYFLLDVYRTAPQSDFIDLLDVATLRFWPRPMRIALFMVVGFGLVIWGIAGLNRALLNPFLRPGQRLVDQIAGHRRRERGPRVVAMGGGHGQATLLRGLKYHSNNITAIVTVADDGGS